MDGPFASRGGEYGIFAKEFSPLNRVKNNLADQRLVKKFPALESVEEKILPLLAIAR